MQDASFERFMQERRRVAAAYVNGDAGPLREISATSDPATFFGPNGGVEQGAAHVIQVNEAGSHRFRPGSTTDIEILHSGADGQIGYWTGWQIASARFDGKERSVPMRLRVTEVFRREGGEWKLIHRHADMLSEAKSRPAN